MEGNGFNDWPMGFGGHDGHVIVFDENGLPLPNQYSQSFEDNLGYGDKQPIPIYHRGIPSFDQSSNTPLPHAGLHQPQGPQPQQTSLPLSTGYFPEPAGPLIGYQQPGFIPQQFNQHQNFWQQPSMTSSINSSSSLNDATDLTSSSSTSVSSQNYSKIMPSHMFLRPSKHEPRNIPSSRSSSSFSDNSIKRRKSGAAKTGSGNVQPKKKMIEFENAIKCFYPRFSKDSQHLSEMLFTQFKFLMEKEIADGNLDAESDDMSITAPSTQSSSMSLDLHGSLERIEAASSVASTPRPYSFNTQDLDDMGAEPEEKVKYYCTYPGCLVPRKDCKCRSKNCKCPRKRGRYWSYAKGDLRRHEGGDKHWPEECYMCLECPNIVEDQDGDPLCSFCFVPFSALGSEPPAHYLECKQARKQARTYIGRKDHLCKHLKEEHGMDTMGDRAKSWSFPIDSDWPRQCGFCGVFFNSRDERFKHVTNHFDKGFKIKDWKLPFPAPKDMKPPGSFSTYKRDEDDDDDEDGDGYGGNSGKSGGKALNYGMSAPATQPTQQQQSYTYERYGSYQQGYDAGPSDSVLNDESVIKIFSPKRKTFVPDKALADTGSAANWISAQAVEKLGLIQKASPVSSYKTSAGVILSSSTVAQDVDCSLHDEVETFKTRFQVVPEIVSFNILLGRTFLVDEGHPTLDTWTPQADDRPLPPPRIFEGSNRRSIALERYLIDPGDRVPGFSAAPRLLGDQSKQTEPGGLLSDGDYRTNVNGICHPHTIQEDSMGHAIQQDNLDDYDEARSRRGGNSSPKCAANLRKQFERLLRKKRLNNLDRSQNRSRQLHRCRTSPSRTAVAAGVSPPSYASLRNPPQMPSPPVDSASRTTLEDSLGDSKRRRTVTAKPEYRIDTKALQAFLRRPRSGPIRTEVFQDWSQSPQYICLGLSSYSAEPLDSTGLLSSAINIFSALQFLHSELLPRKFTEWHMNLKPANILVSVGTGISSPRISPLGISTFEGWRGITGAEIVGRKRPFAVEIPDISVEGEDTPSIMRFLAGRKRPRKSDNSVSQRCGEPGCNNVFVRLCDLKKHEKIHARPWKCLVESCKYFELGWPTEKERIQHHSDKHSRSLPSPVRGTGKSKSECNSKQNTLDRRGWKQMRTQTDQIPPPSPEDKTYGENLASTEGVWQTLGVNHVDGKNLISYEAYTIRKAVPRSRKEKATWARAEVTKADLSQEDIYNAIKLLNGAQTTLQQKKASFMSFQQGQINRLLDDLMATETDADFAWSLAQFERKETAKIKGQKETVEIAVYVKRTSLKNILPVTRPLIRRVPSENAKKRRRRQSHDSNQPRGRPRRDTIKEDYSCASPSFTPPAWSYASSAPVASAEELLDRVAWQHKAYLETFRNVHEVLYANLSPDRSSSPVPTATLRRPSLSDSEAKNSDPMLSLTATVPASIVIGDSDESVGDEIDEEYHDDPRQYLKTYPLHEYASQLESPVYDERHNKFGRAISASPREDERLVIGIDFGTTFKGVAFATPTSKMVHLNPGECFVVCDAGGGTVDVVSFVVGDAARSCASSTMSVPSPEGASLDVQNSSSDSSDRIQQHVQNMYAKSMLFVKNGNKRRKLYGQGRRSGEENSGVWYGEGGCNVSQEKMGRRRGKLVDGLMRRSK